MINFTWHSISLLAIGRTDIGLYPDGSEEFVPFGIGVILPSFHGQSVGNMPEEMERLNNLHNSGNASRSTLEHP